jgi:hypothetical protein
MPTDPVKTSEFVRYFHIYVVEFYDEDGNSVDSEEFDDRDEAITYIEFNAPTVGAASLTKETYRGMFDSYEDVLLED